jgi:hypothetical protein
MVVVVTKTIAKADSRERLVRWFIFSVVIALAPLIYNFLSALTHQRPWVCSLFLVTARYYCCLRPSVRLLLESFSIVGRATEFPNCSQGVVAS